MTIDAQSLIQLLPAIYALRDREAAQVTPGVLALEDRQRLATLDQLLEAGTALSESERQELERLRDKALAGPLGNLLGLLSEQLDVLGEDIDQLYDDQFIETCAEWLVPYIGDLIGYRALYGVSDGIGRARAEVAHTISYRRRKGTVAVFESLAFDVTGWPSVAVEYFQRIITTQYMNHPRVYIAAAPDLRSWEPRDRIGSAFDRVPRTVDVRRIESRRGRHNIPNLGIFLYRLNAQSLTRSPAAKVAARQFRFHPLDIDQPLFTQPRPLEPFKERAEPLNVPMPISRRAFDADPRGYYGTGDAQSLCVYVDKDGQGAKALPIESICVCHLGEWAHMPPAGMVAIDPELGRIGLPPEGGDWQVEVDANHGFPADLGSGEYDRLSSFAASVSAAIRKVPTDFETIQEALDDLGGDGVVEIENSGRYDEALSIHVAAGQTLELRAADAHRPLITLTAACTLSGGENSRLSLNGLLIQGDVLEVPGGTNRLTSLQLTHCTLVPGRSLEPDLSPASPDAVSLVIERDDFELSLTRSICGAIRVAQGVVVQATDCVIDATKPEGLAFAGPKPPPDPDPTINTEELPAAELSLEGCTVFGRIRARVLRLVSNSILLARPAAEASVFAPVFAQRRQDGCVRFSWLPLDSSTPRKHQCLPQSVALAAEAMPRFASQRYGRPDYAQLSIDSGPKLLKGADDEAEPGVYHHVRGAWRETNLHVRLSEYLRVGLRAGVFYET
jgi:hypothetical protein